jgi:hypothetical protein
MTFRTASIDGGEMTFWVNNCLAILRNAHCFTPQSCRVDRSRSKQLRAISGHARQQSGAPRRYGR